MRVERVAAHTGHTLRGAWRLADPRQGPAATRTSTITPIVTPGTAAPRVDACRDGGVT